jgi:hypothetical protein
MVCVAFVRNQPFAVNLSPFVTTRSQLTRYTFGIIHFKMSVESAIK